MSLNNAFTITGATPALLSVVPSSGVQGTTLDVIITGNAFTAFNVGPLSSEFTGEITVISTTPLSASQADAKITIHSDANVGPITANLISGPPGDATLFPFTFTVTPSAASITSVSPSCVPQGGQVTLNVTGLNTIWATAQTVAAFYPGGYPAPAVNEITINSPTSASLAISVPTNTPAGAYGFYLATGGQVVSASINVCAATPTLTMSPANGLLPSGSNCEQLQRQLHRPVHALLADEHGAGDQRRRRHADELHRHRPRPAPPPRSPSSAAPTARPPPPARVWSPSPPAERSSPPTSTSPRLRLACKTSRPLTRRRASRWMSRSPA